MNHGKNRYTTLDGWPDEQQKLLLQCAFLTESSQVCHIWEQWQSHNNRSRIDHASRTILPIVLQNLLKHGANIDPALQKNIQKQYFHIYIHNQRLFKQAAKLIHQLHQAGFKTMVLKGAPLTLQYYNKLGLRFMSDVDILIPTHQALDCIAFMSKLAWKPVSRKPEKFSVDYVTVSHGHEFHHPDGRKIDLHWHVLHECCRPDSDIDFWDAAIPINFSGTNTNALNPADQLLHICVHSARFGSSIPLRSLVDVLIILNQSPIDLDWIRLLSQAKKRKLILPVRETLFYVLKYLNATIPEHISKQFQVTSVAKSQQIEYCYKRQDYHHKKLGYFPIMIFDYLRLRYHMGLWEYLRRFWGTSNKRESLRFLLRTVLKKH
ncbi:nucleotidyltransferase family protein [candidate division CSSED10-310 bacterium]|uniref:Nucleotidyltransferase family protein n=1 Tax=candidate division CSSED10-310 bacterium TaxID=2855610 RepID=A0ABV6Z0J1_UNCC1